MIFSEFLKDLSRKEINISFSGGKIKYSGPEQYINPELIENLKKYKGKLIKHLWPDECTNMMPINTEGKKIPFILLHGEKMNYPLSEYFGADQPFYGFFHYGSEGEKIFHKKVEAFAKDYIAQLQKIVPSEPYYLAGFSFGGLIAFEMALQLQKHGFDVPVLILIDCKIPMFKEPLVASNMVNRMWLQFYNFAKDIYYWLYNKGRSMYYEFSLLFVKNLQNKKRNYYIMRTYIDIAKRYKPKGKYNGEIVLFKSQQNISAHKYLGWDNLCNSVKLINIAGDHKTIYETKESYEILSRSIDDCLQKANDRFISNKQMLSDKLK